MAQDRVSQGIGRTWQQIAVLVLLCGCGLSGLPGIRPAVADEVPAGFVKLFNGKDLTGWELRENKKGTENPWVIEKGILSAKPGWSWIGTTKEYGDFVLRLEWRVPVNGNSGVFLRVPPLKEGEQPYNLGIEVQVLDDNGPQYVGKLKEWQYSGSLYGGVAPSAKAFLGADKWNSYEITCQGDRISVVLNGQKIVDSDISQVPALAKRARRGVLGLQNHGSAVEFRNIYLKELPTAGK